MPRRGFVESRLDYEEIKKCNPTWIGEIEIKLKTELAEKFGAARMIAPVSAVISQAWK